MARTPGHKWMVAFRKLINIQINYLKYSGLWVIDPGHPWLSKSAYLVCKGWTLSAMYIFAITLFADICDNIDNLSITSDDGCVFAGIAVVIFKTMNYQIRQKKIALFVDKVLQCSDDLCEFSNEESIKPIIDKYRLRITVTFWGFSALGCALGFLLLFASPRQNDLPIRAKYPFNTTTPGWRELSFFIETCAVSGGLVAIVGMDSITIYMSSIITMLLDILSCNFESCSGRSANNVRLFATIYICSKSLIKVWFYQENEICLVRNCEERQRDKWDSNKFLHRYKNCIRFHQRLVTLSKEYNRLFSSSMFVQMLSSTSMICLTGFQAVVVGGQSSDIMKFGMYLSAAVSQLLYICWIGNELSYSSSVLDKSQWLSDWHHEHLPSIVQVFTLSTMSTRRTLTLKAGIFFVLSLETFIAIVKGSYSVFTLLNNMQTTDP
ncbi:odorant receptor 13a-like isoform X1 [Megachile rotundata]|uniref:odorant receptor 13a-like isoform X1 n=1 Tax=Megachile rotundata TaxID=143995 RepID=UPI003FD3C907